MKHFFLFLSLLVNGLALPAAAQLDTTGGKFFQPLYRDPAPSVTTDVAYGSVAVGTGTQVLLLDVYQPVGAPATPRPLIILAHGGAFLGGNKADYDVSELCRRFARLGYVTASIYYRLESFFTFNGARAVVNATHDLRAAVRFFRQDAANANQYNINPQYIFVGGSSAGAITAVHLAYLDQEAELASLNAPGVAPGLEGASGNPGYSSAAVAAINLCGALGNLNWLEPGDEPLVSVHGTNDAVVPYATGLTFTGDVVNGSGAIKLRADAVGVPNTLYTFRGAGHVPYNGLSATQQAYMDTTFRTVRDFLRPLLAGASPLPVRLVRFEAQRQGKQALLRWETAQEQNSAGYEVEESADGVAFRRIGFVASAVPNTSDARQYRFRTAEPTAPGWRYYRLRQVDLDGSSSYYGPRAVLFGAEQSRITLAAVPNPATSQDNAAVISSATALPAAQLELRDAQGRLVGQRQLSLPAGTTRVPLPELAGRPAGLYTLELRTAGQRQHVKLVRQ
ncbi:hypothetical protein GCM10027048_37230 [Hymenobacter coalescens]